MSDATLLHETSVTTWQAETVEMVIEQGYRAIPIFTAATAPYGDGQSYDVTDPKWKTSNSSIVGVALDRAVLIDYDGNKPSGAIPLIDLEAILGVDLQKHLVQENSEGNSLHYLFKLPDNLELEDIKASADGWLHGVDVKTKNQLMHLKERKALIDGELPLLNELEVVPDVVIDALRIEAPEFDYSSIQAWDGNSAELNEAKKILSFIDPDCSYREWSAVFAGVLFKFGNTSEAVQILDEWSSNGSKYTSAADVARKAASYTHKTGTPITFNSVCKIAESYGANLAKISAQREAEELSEKFPTLDACFECLADESQEDLHETAFDAATRYIAAIQNNMARSKAFKKLKALTGVGLGEIKESIKQVQKSEDDEPMTHLEMAHEWSKTHKKAGLVGEYGKLWTYSEVDGIWKDKDLNQIALHIAKMFNKEARCARESDYKAIASVAYNGNYERDFFLNAPAGVNTAKGFICVEDGQLITVPASRDHRCTFRLSIAPQHMKTPLFDTLLKDAFGNTYEEQRELLLQLMGCSILGLMPSMQLAVFLYGAGGSGKSTILKIIESMIPSDSRCAVKPEDFGHEYNRAALAGKRFNLVPEIDKDKPLPSADFKSIISGDVVSARETFGKVFTMRPMAANWFNGNFFLTTRDRSDAFWRRWRLIHFIHAKPENERIPDLDKKIVESELSGILNEALEATKRYLSNGVLAKSTQHDLMIGEWKNSANSVLQWLGDMGTELDVYGLGNVSIAKRPARAAKATMPLTVKEAYSHYKAYCSEYGRKPFNKKEFKSHLETAGYECSLYDGRDSIKGLTFYHLLDVRTQEALKTQDATVTAMFDVIG